MAIQSIPHKIPSNFSSDPAPLPTTPKGDAIIKRDTLTFPSSENNSLADKSVTAASTFVRGALPPGRGATTSGKAIIAPTQKGYSRSSSLNLLVAGNQENLNRQISSTLEQESNTVEKTIEKKQAGL